MLILCPALLLQSEAQTTGDSGFQSFIGEVKRGQVFRKSLTQQISFELKLLDGKKDGRIGAYISVFNGRNPKGYKFVLLPRIDSSGDTNWVGIPAAAISDKPNSDKLRSVLDHYSYVGQCMTYFTDNLSRAELDEVRGAWVMQYRHGRSEEEYEHANKVIASLHSVCGIFSVLDYGITENPLRIEHLRFSFDSCDSRSCE